MAEKMLYCCWLEEELTGESPFAPKKKRDFALREGLVLRLNGSYMINIDPIKVGDENYINQFLVLNGADSQRIFDEVDLDDYVKMFSRKIYNWWNTSKMFFQIYCSF